MRGRPDLLQRERDRARARRSAAAPWSSRPASRRSNWTVNGGNVTVEGSATAGDFIVNGGTVTLADGTVITGNSPAIIVNSGTVILQGVTAQTATNSPTIVVNGGSLVVRNSTIEESTGSAQAAILINGGTVDLGTAASPGGNTFNVNGTGTLIQNTDGQPRPGRRRHVREQRHGRRLRLRLREPVGSGRLRRPTRGFPSPSAWVR